MLIEIYIPVQEKNHIHFFNILFEYFFISKDYGLTYSADKHNIILKFNSSDSGKMIIEDLVRKPRYKEEYFDIFILAENERVPSQLKDIYHYN